MQKGTLYGRMGLYMVIGIMLSGIAATNAQDIAKANHINITQQTQTEIKALSIGEKVPNIEFKNLLNYPEKTARLSDFKGKLIILDFWSSSCLSCVKLFPHMQSLQEEFKNDLQIILVNGKTKIFKDNESKTKSILDRLKKNTGKDISLPIIMDCEDLDVCFPWQTIPHEVWIDGNGTVIAITGSNEVNEDNIQAILQGKNVSMRRKNDVSFDLQSQSLSELFYGNSSVTIKPLSSSILLKGMIDGLGSLYGLRREGNSTFCYTGWYITNTSLLELYKKAYRFNLPDNQLIVETKDRSKFQKINFKDTFAYSQVYSYDLTVPPSNFNEIIEKVQSDLEGTFQTSVRHEPRKLKCFIIKATSQLKGSYAKGGQQKIDYEKSYSKIIVQNYPVNALLKELNRFSVWPIINETGVEASIDMELPPSLKHFSAVIQSLQKVGFDVKEEERVINVTVITDR